jgi:hypothetical protein
VTDESKQPAEGILSPEAEPPRRSRRGTRAEDVAKDAPPPVAEAEAKEDSHAPETAPVSSDTKPARRMRFRLPRRG